jgi:hypothetical protein
MIVAVSIFIAVAVGEVQHLRLPRFTRVGFAAMVIGVVALMPLRSGVATLQEARAFHASQTQRSNVLAAAWLQAHYDHGQVLMESFGNETVSFESRIPSDVVIYEGSFRRWEPALADPVAAGIRWIYMRQTPGVQDDVWNRLHSSDQLGSYRLVYQDPDRLVYELAQEGK